MKKNRIISLIMTFVMTLSIAANGVSSAYAEGKQFEYKTSQITKEEKQALNDYIVKKFGTIEDYDKKLASAQKYGQEVTDENGPNKNTIKPEDEVRIVVELSQKSTIEMAKDAKVPLKQASTFSKQVVRNQNNVIASVKKIGNIRNTYQNLFNGFSAVIKFKDIDVVRKLPGVKNVSVAKQYYPDMKTAVNLTQTKTVWEKAGLKGEGIVVAIIDTGIDYTHKDMKITDTSKEMLSKDKVDKLVVDKGAKGKFFTDKVPYGYNFADRNQEVIDKSGSMHGMHVGGIVAANGGISGVAPEAQLLAMKVFSNNPKQRSAFNDDVAAAVEEAWKMGADVINMSLGSSAGFTNEQDPEQIAIKHATEAGVVAVISAGNSAYSTSGYGLPYEKDCDTSMLGDPGLYPDSLQIASSENTNQVLPSLEYKTKDGTESMAYSVSSEEIDPTSMLKEEYQVVECGLGRKEDFKDKDLKGKIALVQRGEISFIDKKLNAQEAEAIGVLVYNKDNDNSYLSMATDENINIPSAFMSYTDGVKLKGLISSGVKLFFRGKIKESVNPSSLEMSDFTSWGTSPDLRFKPEVTAPGGQIYSTVNDNRYESMSGTSMAAPHAAGGVALVVQYLKSKKVELKGREFVNLAKTLLINTAKPQIEKETNLPYLTRRQGAGLVQIYDAIKTNVSAVDQKGSAAIALGELKNENKFTITLNNFGKEDLTFKVKDNYGVLTNGVSKDEIPRLLQNTAKLEGAEVVFDKDEVTVPAGKTALVTATLKISRKAMNQFAEGFISFESKDGKNSNIGVAYMGFFGKWDEPRIFDAPKWEKDSFYKAATLTDGSSFLESRTEGNPKDMAFSPNNDTVQDLVYPIVSLLRNAKELKISVLDKDKKLLSTISNEENVRRNDGTQKYPFTLKENWAWDGTLFNDRTGKHEEAPEGQYYIKTSGKVDYPGAREQEVVMPIKIDKTAPIINPELTKLEGNNYRVKFNANDNMKVCYKMIIVNGDYSKPLAVSDKYDELGVVLPSGFNLVSVVATDFAGNFSEQKDFYINNTFIDIYPEWEKPYIFLTNNNLDIEYIVNNLFTGLGKLNVTLDDKKTENLPLYGNFKAEGLSEGEHKIRFDLVGNDGKVIATRMHMLFVDTKAPVITLLDPVLANPEKDSVKLANGETEYNLKFKVEEENLTGVGVDGNVIEPKNGIYTAKVFLFPETTPKDEKLIVAIDDAGNTTILSVKFDLTSDKPIIKITSPKENETVQGRSISVGGNISNVLNEDRTMPVLINGETVMARRSYDGTYNFYGTAKVDGYGKKSIKVSVEDNGITVDKSIDVNVSPIIVENKFKISSPVMKLDYKISEDCTELDHVDVTVNSEDKINNQKNESINLENLSYGYNIVKLDSYRADGSLIDTTRIEIDVDHQVPTLARLTDNDFNVIASGSVVEYEKLKLRGTLSEKVKSVKINDVEQTIEHVGMFEKDMVYYFASDEFPLEEGMNLIKIEIEDMAGNINNSGLKIIKDSKAPELEILNPKEETVNCTEDTFKLKIRAKDGLGYKLNVNGNEVLQAMSEDYTGEDTLREVEYPIQIKDGETLVNIDAADMNGHVTSKQIKFYKNTDKPIVAINTKNVIGKNVVITGKVYQITKLKDKELNKDIAIKEDGTFTYERGFDSYGDNKTITFVGYDNQGKELTVQPVNFDIHEYKAPTILITSPKDNSTISGVNVRVEGTVEDESDVKVTVNDKEVSLNYKGEFSSDILFDSYARQTITVKTVDVYGNENQKTLNVNTVLIAPYVQGITVTADKNEVIADKPTAVKVNAKYSDGKIVDVTDKATLTCDKGTIEKGIFKAPANYNGKVVIKAEYNSKKAEMELTVKKAPEENKVPEENKEPIRKRLGGVNRMQTSKIIAEEFNNGKVDNVVIASGFSYADALAGSTLAKKLNAPILLVGSTVAESQPSLSYIKEHLNKDGKVYILGGIGAVDESIANSIKLLGYNNITRLAGNDRYKTCKAINEQLNVAKGTPVFLVSGEGFADGLSISSVAAAKGYPVLLTSSNTLSKETKETLKKINPSKVYIIGGTGAISNKVKQAVITEGSIPKGNIERVSGKDRYETSLKVAKVFKLKGTNVCFASGNNFPDALTGTCLASKLNAHIILINNVNVKTQKDYITTTKYVNRYFFGGKGVISDKIMNEF